MHHVEVCELAPSCLHDLPFSFRAIVPIHYLHLKRTSIEARTWCFCTAGSLFFLDGFLLGHIKTIHKLIIQIIIRISLITYS